ncbi:MAG: enoyl-CoA hydratase/isomerase family protein [Rubrobacter sp.]
MAESFEHLGFSVGDSVATIKLDRPEKYNAIGGQMVAEFGAALDVAESSGARAIILTGAGEKAFCSGVDLKERKAMSSEEKWAHNRAINEFTNRLSKSQVPTVAAINGLALGGGFELTLACDFRIAVDHATFALPEVGLGIILGAGGTQRLPRLIGPSRAKEMVLTARRINADTALSWGILNSVVAADELMESAGDLAEEVAKNSPLSVAHAKAAVDIAVETSFEQGFRFETAAIRTTLASPDYEEGLAAFAEKRKPEFPPLTARDIT